MWSRGTPGRNVTEGHSSWIMRMGLSAIFIDRRHVHVDRAERLYVDAKFVKPLPYHLGEVLETKPRFRILILSHDARFCMLKA